MLNKKGLSGERGAVKTAASTFRENNAWLSFSSLCQTPQTALLPTSITSSSNANFYPMLRSHRLPFNSSAGFCCLMKGPSTLQSTFTINTAVAYLEYSHDREACLSIS